MSRLIGIDLGLAYTGYSVWEPGPALVTRGFIRPPGRCKEAQERADFIADQVPMIVQGSRAVRAFVEKPILNAWGKDRTGKAINMTNPESAMSKGRLIGTVERELRRIGVPYDEIGIGRWRAILGIEARGKEAVVVELLKLFAAMGVTFPENVKDDEVEACGIGAAGLIAMNDPSVLAPDWKRPKVKSVQTKKNKAATAKEEGGLFDERRKN